MCRLFSRKMSKDRKYRTKLCLLVFSLLTVLFTQTGCPSVTKYRLDAEKAATNIIQAKQTQALGKAEAFSIERPSDILRRRLLIAQNLPYASQASLGTDKLKAIDHWPEENYPTANPTPDQMLVPDANKPLKTSLMQALQIGARNSFEYQTRKEDVFRAALDLDLERNEFRYIFTGKVQSLYESDSTGKDTLRGTQNSAAFDLTKTLETGATFTTALAVDLVNLLTLGGASSLGVVADATISIPLLRGSGKHIVTEPLTQAERNVVYALYGFERFKRSFAVTIAVEYLTVLKQLNQAENAAENYRNLMTAARRQRRLAEAGRSTEIEVNQAVQNELRARNRWITSTESYKNRLDSFKSLLGLPPDAEIELDRAELEKLLAPASEIIAKISREEGLGDKRESPTAGMSIDLVEPGRENAGPLEMDESLAIQLGLDNRLDLRVALGKVYDAQRGVVVFADALGAELTLFGKAELGQSRSIATAGLDDAKLRTDEGLYSALLTLDLPFERTAERNAYRNSFIFLERAVRDVQELEDEIKLSIRRNLRKMPEARESLRIQARAVLVAEKRVKSTNLFLEAGRTQIRDLLEAQEALVAAKNDLTAAVVDYRVAELEFQRDTGLLNIDEKGLWREYRPEETDNVRNQ